MAGSQSNPNLDLIAFLGGRRLGPSSLILRGNFKTGQEKSRLSTGASPVTAP